MEDDGEYEKKTRAQRKRKPMAPLEIDSDLGSDDSFRPPDDCKHDSSDVADCDSKKKVKKLKLVKKSRGKKKLRKSEIKSRGERQPPLKRSKLQRKKKVCKRKHHAKKVKTEEETETKLPVLKKNLRPVTALGPRSVIGNWYIASGFTKDLATLFKAFNELESWRFSAFATCWQKLKFSLIYRGRYSFKELLEFTEEVCFWTKKFTTPIHNTKWRVGALYALYGLYHKHPLKHYYKIRMELEEYEHLEYLARSFHSAENPDPAYIFYKMKADGVFYYVATSDEMGLNFYSEERQQNIMNYEVQWVLNEHSANTIFPEQERTVQTMLMEEYAKVKSQLWGDGNEPEKGMSYVQPGILSEVDGFLAGLRDDAQDTAPPSANLPKEFSIGQKRGAIRDRAAALSTTDDFLKRKQLRSPRKYSKLMDQTLERSADSVSGSESVQEDYFTVPSDSNKVNKLREIMECMQQSKKGNSDKQEHHFKENYEAATTSEAEDFQDILLPNEFFRDNYNECLLSDKFNGTKRGHYPDYEKKISSLQQNVKVGSPGSFNSRQKIVRRTPGNKKRTGLPNKKIKRTSQTSQLRKFRFQATEQPQVLEENELLQEENKPENILMERILNTCVSETEIEESCSSQGTMSETFPKSKKQTLSLGKRRKNDLEKKLTRYKPNEYKDEIKSPEENGTAEEMLVKEYLAEEMQIPVTGQMAKHQLENKSSEKIGENDSEQCNTNTYSHSLTQKRKRTKKLGGTKLTGCSRRKVEKNVKVADKVRGDDQVAEMVCQEVRSDEVITSTETVCKREQDKKIGSEDSCEKVCRKAKNGCQFSDQPEHESIPHTICAKQIVSESLYQENCDYKNPKRNIVNVVISVKMPEGNHQQSLPQENMFILQVNFQVEHFVIYSTKFKISHQNLEAIYRDDKKLKSLKTKFSTFLPSEYQNHEMLPEFVFHESVTDRLGISLIESPEQVPLYKQEKEFSEQGQADRHGTSHLEPPEQVSLCKPEKDCSELGQLTAGNVCELSNNQASTTTGTDCKVVDNDQKIAHTENTDDEVSCQVTSSSTSNHQPKHESIPNTIDKEPIVSNPTSQEHNDMSMVENIHVELSARMPKTKHHQSVLTGESMVILHINFFIKNVLIHSTKFKITRRDLETIYTDEAKLISLKKKFQSFLPPKYKNCEMLMHLNRHDTKLGRRETSSTYSEQNLQPTSRKVATQDLQTTSEKYSTQNSEISLVRPQLSSVDSAGNFSSSIHAEQTTSVKEEEKSSKAIGTCKERTETPTIMSHVSLDLHCQSTNSVHQSVEQAATTEPGSKVVFNNMENNLPRFPQINTVNSIPLKHRRVLNTNDGSKTASKMHGKTSSENPLDSVKPEPGSFLETNEAGEEVPYYSPPTERGSASLTGNKVEYMKQKFYAKKVLSQDSELVEETKNKGNIFSGSEGTPNTIYDKPPCSLSPPSLPGNSLHLTRSDDSVPSTSSTSVCSFYFFPKRDQSYLPTKKSTKPSSD